ncbi:MAG TPA: ParA family protein [Anaerolineae bacterium]|nr:ParA family protein [Anaerolineae bacterium]
MRKIAVALSKGGVGKTTTAINLAAGVARSGGQVLLVDMDTQGQVAKALGLRPAAGVAEMVMEALPPEQVLVQAREGVWLLAGGRSLAGLKRVISRKDFGGEQTLAEALAPMEGRFDLVLVDTAPAWDTLTVNALFYVEEVLIPVSLEVMALQGLIEFVRALEPIQKYHAGLVLRYIVPTFMDRRVKKSEEILAQLRSYYGGLVCEPVRYNVRLSEAPGYGQTIFEYAPQSPGSQDYQQLTERILRDGRS